MIQSYPSPIRPYVLHKYPNFIKFSYYLLLISAVWGQPNGLFIYIPTYPLFVLTISVVVLALNLFYKFHYNRLTIPKINLWLPLVAFIGLSTFSLAYTPDPAFGARILFSSVFKILIFYIIVDFSYHTTNLKGIFQIITVSGALFALQGVSLTLAVGLFNLQPSFPVRDVTVSGVISYDYQMFSYGLLGFGKVFVQLGSISFPRSQSMFIEPGNFADFLGLSIFCNLACIQLVAPKRKTIWQLMLALQFLAFGLTFSTAGVISLSAGMLFYAYITARGRMWKYSRKVMWYVLVILLCTAILASISYSSVIAIYNAMIANKFSVAWGMSSGELRITMLSKAFELFKQKPLLGWGSNQMRIIAEGLGANNAIATIAVELGSVGLFIYGLILLSIGQIISKSMRIIKHSSDTQSRFSIAASTGAVVALIIHALFIDSNWTFTYWIGIGILYANYQILVRSYPYKHKSWLQKLAITFTKSQSAK